LQKRGVKVAFNKLKGNFCVYYAKINSIMLVQFRLRNYKTFKEEVKLSLVPSKYFKERDDDNLIDVPRFGMQLLKSAVIYGANASGKTKLVEAMVFMKKFIVNSSKDTQKGDPIDVQPFRLSTETENEPSEFEVIFIHEEEMFRYGFEVTKDKVVAEWLFHKERVKEVELFYREEQTIEVHRNFKVGDMLSKENLVRENALLLSVAAQFNDTKAGKIFDWLDKFKALPGLNEDGYRGYTMSRTHDQDVKEQILKMIKHADIGIEDLKVEQSDLNEFSKVVPDELRKMFVKTFKDKTNTFYTDVLTTHKKYDINNQFVEFEQFSMGREESSGTQKFYALTVPILETLASGNTMVVDELDSKLHPNLVSKLVEIFNSREHNPLNAQLIFNTHDTNLLSYGSFRRDQIWFTEKDRFGAAKLYSLSDIKKIREKDPIEENYILGKYGGVPNLGDFNMRIFNQKLPAYENEK
jgi:AAA15 family ATPase/GTPase